MLDAVVHVAAQPLLVDVTVIVYPPVKPAVTFTEEPVVALKLPLPEIAHANVDPGLFAAV